MNNEQEAIDFAGLSEKLDGACQKLWLEDKVAAIPLQASINEVSIAFRQAEVRIASLQQALQEQATVLKQEYDARYHGKMSVLEEKLAAAHDQIGAFRAELDKAKTHINALLKDIAEKEDQNIQFQEKFLKMETDKDSVRAKHMEEFVAGLEQREKEREANWKQRQLNMEKDVKQQHDDLQLERKRLLEEMKNRAAETEQAFLQKENAFKEIQKQFEREFQERENRLRERDDALRSVAERAQELERGYAQKRAELDKLKQDLRAEISELTRQYRPKGS